MLERFYPKKGDSFQVNGKIVKIKAVKFYCNGANNSETLTCELDHDFYSLTLALISVSKNGEVLISFWLREEPHCENCATGREPHCGIRALADAKLIKIALSNCNNGKTL